MDRREFLKASSIVGSSLLLAPSAIANAAIPGAADALPAAGSQQAGAALSQTAQATSGTFLGLPLSATQPAPGTDILDRYGIPFLKETLRVPIEHPARFEVGGEVRRIYLLGMTESAKISGWSDPDDYTRRYFIGEDLGEIQLEYVDGTSQIFPLILGQSLWWGPPFNRFQEPFPADTQLRDAFTASMRLYPPKPVEDGIYAAVIAAKAAPLKSITLEASRAKQGQPVLAGITLETTGSSAIAGTTVLKSGELVPEFAEFIKQKTLRPAGRDEQQTAQELEDLKRAVYSSNEYFTGKVAPQAPEKYSGPQVSFKGTLPAEVLSNAFCWNVQDMLDKIDDDGMYHTSTKGALWWNDGGLGSTYTGKYYPQSWSRDLGRSLQELCELGFVEPAVHCAAYCMRMARLWEENPSLNVKGQRLPRHWGRMINMPDDKLAFENDGHALITVFFYKLWQRLPNREQWLRSNWTDVKAAGDWILWQFAHPEISGATDGLLRTTGESANGSGYSAYPDCACLNALRSLAQMADSIGESDSAMQWRQRADKMQAAIGSQYIVSDAKYGRVWTLEHAGWPYKSTVLGPLVLLADYEGFAPQDEKDGWRSVDEAAYQRLIDTYQPFGFYGLTMGYGQGFVTQSALLLDRMRDATTMLDWLAKQIYDPRLGSFIVSEGVQIDPTGRFWYRFGDLGNGVQEAEIIKVLRLVIGLDDTQPGRVQFYPRMPYGWKEVAVEKYPVLLENAGSLQTAELHYRLVRSGDSMHLELGADKEFGPIAMRVGPFAKEPKVSSLRVNGRVPAGALVEHSGDSWWVRFQASIGPVS